MDMNTDVHSRSYRAAEICAAWISGQSVKEITARFGCAAQTVKKARRAAGLKETDRKVKPQRKQLWQRKAHSGLHAQLGHDVATYRQRVKLSLAAFAAEIGVTMVRLVEIEAGVHDVTVVEVQRLAAVMRRPAHELLMLRNCAFAIG
jgi:DNA-binding transcriptional regulator YiaG